jgi:hypothetical protein
VDGVDPLQLSTAVAYIETAIGIHAAGYNVTVPAFQTTDLATEHAAAVPDAERLGRLNVRYVASEFDIDVPGLVLAEQFNTTRLYLNELDRGRAWLEEGQGAVEITAWSPDQIEVQAEGPGLLVLSEINYPGWGVTVDGDEADLETFDGALRAVRLPEGTHTVVFTFRPQTVYWGFGLGMLGLVGWGFVNSLARRAALERNATPTRLAAPPRKTTPTRRTVPPRRPGPGRRR